MSDKPDPSLPPLEEDPVFSRASRARWAAWKKHPPRPAITLERLEALRAEVARHDALFASELREADAYPVASLPPLDEDLIFTAASRQRWAVWKRRWMRSACTLEDVLDQIRALEIEQAEHDAEGEQEDEALVAQGLALLQKHRHEADADKALFESERREADAHPVDHLPPLHEDPVFTALSRKRWAAWQKHWLRSALTEEQVLAQLHELLPVEGRARPAQTHGAAPKKKRKAQASPAPRALRLVGGRAQLYKLLPYAALAALVVLALLPLLREKLFPEPTTAARGYLCHGLSDSLIKRPAPGSEAAVAFDRALSALENAHERAEFETGVRLLKAEQQRRGEDGFAEEREMVLLRTLDCEEGLRWPGASRELQRRGKAFVEEHGASPYAPEVELLLKRLDEP